MQEMGV